MKQIRHAICISGQLRSVSECVDSWRTNIFDQLDTTNNIDIFISISSNDPHIESGLKILNDKFGKMIRDIEVWDDPVFEDIDLYKTRPCRDVKIKSFMFQMYNIKMANQLKQRYEKSHQHITYSSVMKLRPDTLFLKPVENVYRLKPGVFFPLHDNWGGLHDRFYFGYSPMMDVIDNRFDYIHDFFRHGGILHAETFLRSAIEYYGVPIFPSQTQVQLKRISPKITAPVRNIVDCLPEMNYQTGQWHFHRKWYNNDLGERIRFHK